MKGEFVEGKISVGRNISGDSKGRRGNGRHCDAGHRTTRDILLIFYRQTAPDRSFPSFPSIRDTYTRRISIFLALLNSVHVWICPNSDSD